MDIQIRNINKRRLAAALVIVAFAACSGGESVPPAASPQSSVLQSSSARPGPTYRLVRLGDGLVPNKINNAGVVVGLDLNTNRPFEYKDGRVTDLPLLQGDTTGDVFDINNEEQIVGQSFPPTLCVEFGCIGSHAVLYDHGKISDLGTFSGAGGDVIYNAAEIINDNGEIVGQSSSIHEGGFLSLVIFSPGPIRYFPNAEVASGASNVEGVLAEINNAGEIAGASWSIFGSELLAYPNPIVCSPPLVVADNEFDGINNAGDTISTNTRVFPRGNSVYCQKGVGHNLQLFASALNDGGDIVGSATAAAVVFSHGKFHKIDAISGTKFGRYFVSRDRTIQGFVLSVSPGDALLYSKGTYYDLNDLVPNHPGLVLQNPSSINNRREIVGATVTSSSQTVGWLLVPR